MVNKFIFSLFISSVFVSIIFITGCSIDENGNFNINNNSSSNDDDDDDDDESSNSNIGINLININYRQYMRDFVQNISNYARMYNNNFIVIPQNGNELLTLNGESNGIIDINYISAINGVGREDLFYGYNNDDEATPEDEKNYMIEYLDLAEKSGIEVLVTDYCTTHLKVDDSYNKNFIKNYISFAASRELNDIPGYPVGPWNENNNNIISLNQAKNFLYLINPEKYSSKSDFINAIKQTNYDVVLIDLFFNNLALTAADISQIKIKKDGGSRLVLAYMSIGEAENYRYYWQTGWTAGNPYWLDKENPDWLGNYKVKYWDPNWQAIIYGNDNSYLKKILDAGLDGVYLDIIDAFEYYEN